MLIFSSAVYGNFRKFTTTTSGEQSSQCFLENLPHFCPRCCWCLCTTPLDARRSTSPFSSRSLSRPVASRLVLPCMWLSVYGYTFYSVPRRLTTAFSPHREYIRTTSRWRGCVRSTPSTPIHPTPLPTLLQGDFLVELFRIAC